LKEEPGDLRAVDGLRVNPPRGVKASPSEKRFHTTSANPTKVTRVGASMVDYDPKKPEQILSPEIRQQLTNS
jgi:hypothetical protein